jgi:cellulose synthase/poly-beta-1,6-N-acetylglucosamine synthase-like glycosyltransferase
VHAAGAVAWTDPPQNLRHLLAQRRRWCLGHYQNIFRHLPRRGKALAFIWAVYPNFVFLSVFLPALALTALAMLIFGTGGYQDAIWSSTALWLPLVYCQRVLGLWVAGRRSSPLAVLIEPFTTTLLHAAAALMVFGYWLRVKLGRSVDVWSIRD